MRLARRQGLKARAVNGKYWGHLAKTPLPAITQRVDGDGFVIVANVVENTRGNGKSYGMKEQNNERHKDQ